MNEHSIDMTLEDRKVELICQLFIDPADEDYMAARWAYSVGIFHSFYWSAAQAFEKYLKAILLFQEESTIGYGHKLVSLLQKAKQLDKNSCLPKSFDLPDTTAMGKETWQEKPMELFADYLQSYGSVHNRYAIVGTFVNGPVLHVLDICCLAFRKYIRSTNFLSCDIFDFCSRDNFPSEKIENPECWMIGPKQMLERLYMGRYRVGENKELRQAFLNMNFAFSDTRNDEERTFGGQHFTGSPLYNHLVRFTELDTSEDNRMIVRELRSWVQKNIQISREIDRNLFLKSNN